MYVHTVLGHTQQVTQLHCALFLNQIIRKSLVLKLINKIPVSSTTFCKKNYMVV